MYVIAHVIARATLPRSSRGSSRGAVRHRPEGGSERRARPGRAGVPHLAERGLEGLVWGVSRRLAWCFWAGRRDVWDGGGGAAGLGCVVLVWAGLGRAPRGVSDRLWRGVAPGCGVVCLAGSASRVAGFRAGLRGVSGPFRAVWRDFRCTKNGTKMGVWRRFLTRFSFSIRKLFV